MSGLSTKTEVEQVNALIYCMGDQVDDVFISLQIPEDRKDKYDDVKRASELHFIVKRNVIYDRAIFNRRSQGETESVDEYITDLYRLAEPCEYGVLKEDFIRDRLVVGLRDIKLSERMQLISDLTLEIAVRIAKQSEQIKRQLPVLHNDMKTNIDRIHSRKQRKQESFNRKSEKNKAFKENRYKREKTTSMSCRKCGGGPHPGRECPASKVACHGVDII